MICPVEKGHRGEKGGDISWRDAITRTPPFRGIVMHFGTLCLFAFFRLNALQIQCYQCEEMKHNDCSTPEYVVNCTVNVQDMCQKEVLVKPDGIHYRKSCASSGACLIASSGYQQFCTGRLNSVCISCCNTPLCNGPKRKRPVPSAAPPGPFHCTVCFLFLNLPLLLW
uniref:Ly6/PLAUR domain-containing protein 1-like n=1 Tax=Scophthalmus maximus TaxID=52904 RepID=A0A8D3D738_SCOMX